MSDEYSVGNAFLCGRIDATEYWRKMARVAKREEEHETKALAAAQRNAAERGMGETIGETPASGRVIRGE